MRARGVIPGASFNDTGGLIGNEVKFRGVGHGIAQLSPTTAVYLGEVPVIHTGRNVNSNYNFRLVDMNRIEVLRGPQGQLFGSNSLGGAIRNIPNKPDLDKFGARGSLGGGGTWDGDASYNGDITLNVPMIENLLGARITGYHATDGGWYDNVYAGGPALGELAPFAPPIPIPGGALPAATMVLLTPPGVFPPAVAPGPPGILAQQPAAASYSASDMRDENVNETETNGARVMLTWQPNNRFDADFMLAYEESRVKDGAFAAHTVGTPHPVIPGVFNTDVFPGNFPSTVMYLTDARQYEHSSMLRAGKSDEMALANLVMNYDLGFATLTSSTSYWDRQEDLEVDISGLSVLVTGVGNTVPFHNARSDNPETVIQELRLTSRDDQRLRWLAGVFYQDMKQNFNLQLTDQSDLDLLFFNQSVRNSAFGIPVPGTRNAAAQVSTYNDETSALFGEMAYDLTETLTASFGFRWFHVDQDFTTLGVGFQFLGAGLTSGQNSETVFTPKFNLTWKPTGDHMFYVTAAEGFRTGIVNRVLPPVNCGVELANAGWPDGVPPTVPDTLWNFELGTKSNLTDRLSVNAATYHIKWKDKQTAVFMSSFAPIPAFSQCSADVVANVGDVSIYGVELEASVLITDRFRMDWAFSYTDGEYDDDFPQSRIVEGNSIENQPDFTSFLGLNYELSVRNRPSFARLEWEFVGNKQAKYTDFVTQAQPFEIGDYHQLNLRVGMDFSDHVSIQAFVNNLTNEFGVVTSLDTGGLGAPILATIRPRTAGIRMIWK